MLPRTLAIILFATSLLADEPEKLTKLRGSYESAMSKATAPIQKTYITELEKLKIEFTKSGNLEAALAVDAELKTLAESSSSVATSATTTAVDKSSIPKEAHRGRYGFYLGVNTGREITWEDAKKQCDELGGRLVCLTDAKKLAEVIEYRNKAKVGRFWAGAFRLTRDGPFVWTDGTEFKPIGVPGDHTNGNPGGLQIDVGTGWHLQPHGNTAQTTSFICEWPRK